MKRIPLTKGQFALVDDADFEWLNQWKWCYGARHYAYRGVGTKTSPRIWMHRLIMNAPKDKEVDHINGNGIDNRRQNLRLATRLQNSKNIHKLNSSSGFKGVYRNTTSGKYWATITHDKKKYYLGTYLTAEEAARAYNDAAIRFHGDFSSLNKVQPGKSRKIVGGANLTIDDVHKIKELANQGLKTRKIMDIYGITQSAVWKIKNNVSYKEKV